MRRPRRHRSRSPLAASRLSLDCAGFYPMYNAPRTIATSSQLIAPRWRFCVPARILPLLLHSNGGLERRNVGIDHLVIAGWTGRDKAALEKHIAELEALGVKRPASVPIFYRAAAARLTIDDEIEMLGERIERRGGVRPPPARRPLVGRRRFRSHRSRGREVRRLGLQADVRQAGGAGVLAHRRGGAALGQARCCARISSKTICARFIRKVR